jgi:hypothetical protein
MPPASKTLQTKYDGLPSLSVPQHLRSLTRVTSAWANAKMNRLGSLFYGVHLQN